MDVDSGDSLASGDPSTARNSANPFFLLKEEGNRAYEANDLRTAIATWERALASADGDVCLESSTTTTQPPQQSRSNDHGLLEGSRDMGSSRVTKKHTMDLLKAQIHANLAQAHLQLLDGAPGVRDGAARALEDSRAVPEDAEMENAANPTLAAVRTIFRHLDACDALLHELSVGSLRPDKSTPLPLALKIRYRRATVYLKCIRMAAAGEDLLPPGALTRDDSPWLQVPELIVCLLRDHEPTIRHKVRRELEEFVASAQNSRMGATATQNSPPTGFRLSVPLFDPKTNAHPGLLANQDRYVYWYEDSYVDEHSLGGHGQDDYANLPEPQSPKARLPTTMGDADFISRGPDDSEPLACQTKRSLQKLDRMEKKQARLDLLAKKYQPAGIPLLPDLEKNALPVSVPLNLIVILHGFGDSFNAFRAIPEQWKLPRTAYLILNACDKLPRQLTGTRQGYSWFDYFDLDAGDWYPEFSERSLKNCVARGQSHMDALIRGDLMRRMGWTASQIFLCGFSQGGTFCWEWWVEQQARAGNKAGIQIGGLLGVSSAGNNYGLRIVAHL